MTEQATARKVPSKAAPHAEPPPLPARDGLGRRMGAWFIESGPWWLCSFVFHAVLLVLLALLGTMGTGAVQQIAEEAPPAFEEADLAQTAAPEEIERFEVGETPEEPTELNTDTLLASEKPATITQEAEYNDDSPAFEPKGGGVASAAKESNSVGLGGLDIRGIGAGPVVKGRGGVGIGVGAGTHPGSGDAGWGFGGRGSGSRKALLASGGGTKQSERAVAAALNWLARHQLSTGAWGLISYKSRCKDATCSGPGKAGERPIAATALALLPFLAAGQTHESRGPYKRTIAAGVRFLTSSQRPNGDLRLGGDMYDHGLAAIALSECYGMTGAKSLRAAAQSALNFIMESQDPKSGGWRYDPRQPGDTSVTGWQIMALKSGQMAYLTVDPVVFERARAFLKTVTADGKGGGRFGYLPNPKVDECGVSTTAIGLLCQQYSHMARTDPAMVEGTSFLMQIPPSVGDRNVYYWYYATQAMHNQPGPQWDVWNRQMRHTLIDTQCKEGCAAGSWDPEKPTKDIYGDAGGRLMMTSLSALTLEVYYRYLPLYKIDKQGDAAESGAAAKQPGKTP